MLPGFRFLLAAIALSVSILIFGLGAAALLRSAHEEFASNPSWRVAPEPPLLAQQPDANRPVLAMLQVEPQSQAREAGPAQAIDATPERSPVSSAPAEPESVVMTPPETEKVAALNPQDVPVPTDAANAGARPAETAATSDAAPPPVEETSVAAIKDAKPQANDTSAPATENAKLEVKSGAKSEAGSEVESVAAKTEATTEAKAEPKAEVMKSEPARPDPTVAPAQGAADSARTAAAAPTDPAATRPPRAKKDVSDDNSERSERSIDKARLKAQRIARERRRLAQRARAARQQAAAQQQQTGLFAQQPTPARAP